jgi:Rap guanine nucleotide exchange factor 2
MAVVDSQSVLLQLNADEVSLQLTDNDFELFRSVEPTEYIDDLFDTDQRVCYGTPNLTKFAEVFLVYFVYRCLVEV